MRGIVAWLFLVSCGAAPPRAWTPPFSCADAASCGKLCDAGNWLACAWEAGNLRTANADQARAVELAQHACDRHVDLGCHYVAQWLVQGWGLAKDPARANAMFTKLCDGGLGISCNELGNDYYDGIGIDKDQTRAIQLYRKACETEKTWSCVNLAVAAASGVGMAKDPALAVKLLDAACTAKFWPSCARLGNLYIDGTLPRDSAAAFRYFNRGCILQDGYGCLRAGQLYKVGDGIAKDSVSTEWYMRQACALAHFYSGVDYCSEWQALDSARAARATQLGMSWQPFRSETGRFTIEMPGAVTYSATKDDGKAATTETKGGAFMAMWWAPSADTAAVPAQVERALADANATLISNTPIVWYGWQGAEVRMKSGDSSVRMRFFVVNNIHIRLWAENADDADADHFFSTLNFF
jgi:hypothetical protein